MAGDQRIRLSLEGKVTLLVGVLVALAVAAGAFAGARTGRAGLGLLFGLALGLPLAFVVTRRFMAPVNRVLQALIDGTGSLTDSDFSVSLAETRNDELGALVQAYNAIGQVLRDERHDLFQRELLLDTVIQATPLALVLEGPTGAVVYSNAAARQLFLGGRKLEGSAFRDILENAPAPLGDAVGTGGDGLFTIEGDNGPETFHLSQKAFLLNARTHRLFLFKHLTRELSRREVAIWKNVIRVIGHELNNSLAPVSSLAHSGGRLAEALDSDKLKTIFATIEDRTRHLKDFIEGYARFARLPRPELQAVDWTRFVAGLSELARFRLDGDLPAEPGWFDPAQLEQVLINLLKNAHESGSPPEDVSLSVSAAEPGQRIVIGDRGSGMSETVLASAWLPFYSTKRTGTGLGLPLCREVAEAHGGRLSLNNRDDGGLEVSLWLPAGPPPGERTMS